MEQNKFKFPIRIFIFAISLFILSFSASYSYFTVTPNYASSAEERTTNVTTDYLDFNFITSKYIHNTNMLLIKHEDIAEKAEKTSFTVSKKEGVTYTIKYNIYLTELTISDNLKSEDFKWELLQNNSPIYNGTFKNAKTGEMLMLTEQPLVLSDATSASYELRVWLEETDSDQSDLFNGSVSAKVGVDVYTVSRSS